MRRFVNKIVFVPITGCRTGSFDCARADDGCCFVSCICFKGLFRSLVLEGLTGIQRDAAVPEMRQDIETENENTPPGSG